MCDSDCKSLIKRKSCACYIAKKEKPYSEPTQEKWYRHRKSCSNNRDAPDFIFQVSEVKKRSTSK